MRGEVEKDEGVLVIRRIHVRYRLRAGEDQRETVERVHAFHRERCPVYMSIRAAIDISTEYELAGEA